MTREKAMIRLLRRRGETFRFEVRAWFHGGFAHETSGSGSAGGARTAARRGTRAEGRLRRATRREVLGRGRAPDRRREGARRAARFDASGFRDRGGLLDGHGADDRN